MTPPELLAALPDVPTLRRVMQSAALLDAVLCPRWDGRRYSFNRKWAKGEMLGSVRTGSGDTLFALFGAAGCWVKGFAHESAMSPFRHTPPRLWPGVLDGVPTEFAACLTEPAFELDAATFCVWRLTDDAAWQRGPVELPAGPDPDGSAELLAPLGGGPAAYHAYAEAVFERKVSLAAVERVYAHEPLSAGLVAALNPRLTLAKLGLDLKETGYPKLADAPGPTSPPGPLSEAERG